MKYIETANVGIITNTALRLDVLEILPFSLQSLISLPNILWFKSQFSILLDDLEKNHAEAKTQGVVGTPGNIVPAMPTPRKISPTIK